MGLLTDIDVIIDEYNKKDTDDIIISRKSSSNSNSEDKEIIEDKFVSEAEEDKKEEKGEKKEEKGNEKEEKGEEGGEGGEEGEDSLDDLDTDFGEEEELSLDDLGKVHQLKTLYDELVSLFDITYDMLIYDNKLKNAIIVIKKLIDYYKLVAYNINQFKEKLDDIIKLYRRIVYYLYKYLEIKSREIERNVKKQ